jgi:hypothetical protein
MVFLNRPHRVATICGAVPFFLGTGIFVAWLLLRSDWLIIAGMVVVYAVGPVAVAAGAMALVLSSRTALRTPAIPRRRIWVSTLTCAGLLLANVLVAMGITWLVIAIATRYTVVVYNASQKRLDGVRVSGGGCDASYGSLLPRANARRSFWITQDGGLVFRASSGDAEFEQTVAGYVTTNLGGHLRVTVQPDGTITATNRANQPSVFDLALWRDRSPCNGEPVEQRPVRK